MKNQLRILILILLLCSSSLFSQEKAINSKEVVAYKVNEKINIDGKLLETIYRTTTPVDDFTQIDPDEGKPSTEKTEVWTFYDDHNFYVAAKLYDSSPDSITKILGRRDNYLASDYFGFAIDTYFDKRNAFFFLVNPSGSIIDGMFYNDSWQDDTWDGVWDYGVTLFDSGWCVEIRVPFSQLRFKDQKEQIWGINFYRKINRKKEDAFFVYIPKKESGFVSHFAILKGLNEIKQKQRIEFLPYSAGKAQYFVHDPLDPFYKKNQFQKNFGLDFKIGVGSNLTIDGTINPDFGQVEVDPAVINLSAFETFYAEKRPFFIEGRNYLNFGSGGSNSNFNFNWSEPKIFYSRRIGRSPRISVEKEGYVNYPNETRILGAAKLTGKITNDWSVYFLNAITERTYAEIDSENVRSKQEIEPLTYYGVFRTQKEFNSGKQSIGIISTAVLRDNHTPLIDSKLVRSATTIGLDGWTYIDKDENYILTGYLIKSQQFGSKDAIRILQEAPQRYFQRPDAKKFKLDTTLTEFSGYAGRLTLNKQKGNFFLNSAFGFISPEFDVNELGFQSRSDILNSHLVIGYRWFNPDGITRRKSIHFAMFANSDFEGNLTGKGFMFFGGFQLMNYYSFNFDFGVAPQVYDKELTRGGPLTVRPTAYWYSASFESDETKNFVVELGIHNEILVDGTKQINSELSFQWKPNSQLNISLTPQYEYTLNKSQWITKIDDIFASKTFGSRYIFGEMLQKTVSANIRLNWTFTPKLTLQLFAQPLISAGSYSNIKELKEPRTHLFNTYGIDAGWIMKRDDNNYEIDPDGNGNAPSFILSNPDFNFKSFRSNLVLRWEFLPGSSFYFVWTHFKNNYENIGDLSIKKDFKDLFNSRPNNILMIKITYWLDI
jgi:hypothetical protein